MEHGSGHGMGATTLIGDLGGTNLRLALTDGDALAAEAHFRTADYPGLEAALEAYFAGLVGAERPERAILAVAGPVGGDLFRLTNCPWQFSRADVRKRFGWSAFRLINDFSANSAALPYLQPEHLEKIKPGISVEIAPKLVLGPGTGLGVGAAVPDSAGGWSLVDGEGGHVSLAASDAAEADLLARLRHRTGFAEAEHLLSGAGLALLCALISERDGSTFVPAGAKQVLERFDAGDCAVAREAVERFAGLLGTVAGNAALTLGARGGVYLAGGVMGHLGARFRGDLFIRGFIARSRMHDYLDAIPVWRITHPEPGLFGLRMLARDQVR